MRGCQRFELIYMFSKFQSLPSYFGGKRKLVKYIFKPIKKKDGVFIDAFLGGGSVSLYAKAKGYKVIANDIAYRSLIIGKAIIANNSVKLVSEDLARLFVETKHDGFIKKNYCPKVFTTKIADFLDNAGATDDAKTSSTCSNLNMWESFMLMFISINHAQFHICRSITRFRAHTHGRRESFEAHYVWEET